MVDFDRQSILTLINALNVDKAYGADLISVQMIKLCGNSILLPLSSYLYPLTSILLPLSSYLYPLTSILLPLSSYLYPLTSILLPLSSYLYPLTSILLPLSSYLYPLTSILLPLSSYLYPLTSSPILLPKEFSLINGKLLTLLQFIKRKKTQIIKNYRPISLLPIFAELFEKMLFLKMYNYFISNNLITKNQSGFRPNDSNKPTYFSS